MKILYLAESLPYYPCKDGFRILAYNTLKYLSRNNQIHLVAFSNPEITKKYVHTIEKFCATIETVQYHKPDNFYKWIRQLLSLCTFNKSIYDKIIHLINKHQIELIYAEGANIGQYVYKIKNIPKIIAPHDSSSLRAHQLFKHSRNPINKLWFFMKWIKKIMYEKEIYNKFDHCIVVGPKDKEVINQNLPNLKVSVLSNGVDGEYYKFKPLGTTIKNNIIFTGDMSFYPNEDAVLYFCKEILPLIHEDIKGLKFYIVGANPSKNISALAEYDFIFVTGTVEDIRKYVNQCSVYICPMRLGTGIKNKILEAMAMGIPIVSSKLGAEGINVTDGQNILIADKPVDFKNKVVELLNSNEKRLGLSLNARNLIDNQYRWEAKGEMLEQIIKNVMQEGNYKNGKNK
ncbi:MAG: glycosyltransferase [Candidatus Omnitrophica bacterium]|nr:glycosyltransferase [Candidatus Omnitrophota bacterium]